MPSKSELKRLETQTGVRFLHLRSELGRGAVTIAYRVQDKEVHYVIAKCNPQDNFCRRIGREICLGRMATAVQRKHEDRIKKMNFVGLEDTKKQLIEKYHPDRVGVIDERAGNAGCFLPRLRDANDASSSEAFCC